MTKRTFTILITAILLGIIALPLHVYLSIPTSNTTLTHFDTLIVLGYPSNPDGSPSPEQRERVLESVREYRHGIAPHIIMSGGAAHNQFAEADSMKRLAISQGIPADAVLEDAAAQNTLQNILFSSRIMAAHHWHSAEVISSPSHLPRAALILQHYPIAWRTHPSLWPREYNVLRVLLGYVYEIRNCWQIHRQGFAPNSFPKYRAANLSSRSLQVFV
jgi:uncharacterized SAM-binding protein YcdF (DUF218 family)